MKQIMPLEVFSQNCHAVLFRHIPLPMTSQMAKPSITGQGNVSAHPSGRPYKVNGKGYNSNIRRA